MYEVLKTNPEESDYEKEKGSMLTTRMPQTTRGKRATTKGATGPKPSDSAVTLEMIPAKMAIIPFQKVVIEKVIPIHSEGNPCLSECSYTYLFKSWDNWKGRKNQNKLIFAHHDSKVEKSIDVDIPVNELYDWCSGHHHMQQQ